MRAVVTGATGLIGGHVVPLLRAKGWEVAVLTRSAQGVPWPDVTAYRWEARPDGGPWAAALDGAEAVVHLAGEPIASRRWTAAQKERILTSRVLSTRALMEAIARAGSRPHVLVSASAIGYYGLDGDEEKNEDAPPGPGFLSRVCQAWEAEAQRAEAYGVRVVLLRFGVVLDAAAGALPALVRPFRLGVGGPLGSGRQWLSWIHVADAAGLVAHLLAGEARGPVNAVAPEPVRAEAFARILGQVLGRPAWLRLPATVLRLALGEMAEELLLRGPRAVPRRAQELGYVFRYPALEAALAALLAPKRGSGGAP